MRICPLVVLFYPILVLCQLATWPVSAGWQGDPPLKMKYYEHEFLAACPGIIHTLRLAEQQWKRTHGTPTTPPDGLMGLILNILP